MAHVRSYGEPKPCESCGRSFAPRKDGISKGHGRFCSIGCSNWSRSNQSAVALAELRQLYVGEKKTIDVIAKTLGSNRKAVRKAIEAGGIPIRSGGYLPTENSHRTTYRKEASKNIGRKLSRGETVHHVDLNPRNNAESNLAVLPSRTAHQMAHRQLEALAGRLVRNGLICWQNDTYIFSGKMEGLLNYA